MQNEYMLWYKQTNKEVTHNIQKYNLSELFAYEKHNPNNQFTISHEENYKNLLEPAFILASKTEFGAFRIFKFFSLKDFQKKGFLIIFDKFLFKEKSKKIFFIKFREDFSIEFRE